MLDNRLFTIKILLQKYGNIPSYNEDLILRLRHPIFQRGNKKNAPQNEKRFY